MSPTMVALVAGLFAWLGAHSEYRIPTNPHDFPQIQHESADALKARFGHPALALFDWETNTVYLDADFDHTSNADRAKLLHELSHALQKLNGRVYSYLAQGEEEAYGLQRMWEKERGLPQNDPLSAALFSMGPVDDED